MLLILAACSLAQNKLEKDRDSATFKGLHLAISINGDSYRLGDIAILKIRLKNIGHSPITIYR
jgi:hypothetical protein